VAMEAEAAVPEFWLADTRNAFQNRQTR